MRKKVSILLGVLLVFTMLFTGVNAEAENLLAKDAKWYKALAKAEPTVITEDGESVVSFGEISSAWGSCGIDVYPSLKKAIGDEDVISVYFVFDAKVIYKDKADEDTAFPFGIKLRPDGLSAAAKSADTFPDVYSGINFKYDSSNLSCTLLGGGAGEMSKDWQTFEVQKEFDSDDFADGIWTKWTFCFDNMKENALASAIYIKNFAIYLEDEYEPAEAEDEDDDDSGSSASQISASFDEKTLETPYNYNRYQITFAKTKENKVTADASQNTKNEDTSATPVATAAADATDKKASDSSASNTWIIYVIIAAAVVICGAVAVIVILKKKKGETK